MIERRKDILVLTVLLVLFILFFSKILFTDKIIRAPDIINELYWSVKDLPSVPLKDLLKINLVADWNMFDNSGDTTEGGWSSIQFLLHKKLIFHFFPSPANVAWFILFHLFIGAAGTYFCCRAIGASRFASFIGGVVFSLAPETASLINAGHVLKMATISLAPWGFYFFERTMQSRRLIYAMTTAVVLAFQFFHGHWQISFYTCLALGLYALARGAGEIWQDRRNGKRVYGIVGLNVVVLVFFLSTVAVSLLPLASWSRETNRGSYSGANQGKGGLQYEEAMSWSLPPEELAAFVVPGFFGYSRQEAGENPKNIDTYYWGRMNFTQTISYFGLLPWLLVPLPLLFRRDRYTWLALAAVIGGILFSIGKYSVFYQILFDYFPGINKFRVPKMMMFIPVLGLGVLASRGIDCLRDEQVRMTKHFRRYLWGIASVPVALLALLGVIKGGEAHWINYFVEYLGQPTRYEQGPQLVVQRWQNITTELIIAVVVATAHALVIIVCGCRRGLSKALPFILLALYLIDVGRVNAKFMFLVDVPQKSKEKAPLVFDFLARDSQQFRTLPLDRDPLQFVSAKIPVLFTSHPVQLVRWQEYLDNLSFASPMPDIMNLKYLVMSDVQFQTEKGQFGDKYDVVYQSPDRREVVLQNRTVMPKAWLVSSVYQLPQPQDALNAMRSPTFDPRTLAFVEAPPPFAMGANLGAGTVRVDKYEGEKIELTATVAANSLLVLGEKYYRGWKATVDGKPVEIHRVNYVQRGVYLTPGNHEVTFKFDPVSYKVGKWLTLSSFALFAGVVIWELLRRKLARV